MRNTEKTRYIAASFITLTLASALILLSVFTFPCGDTEFKTNYYSSKENPYYNSNVVFFFYNGREYRFETNISQPAFRKKYGDEILIKGFNDCIKNQGYFYFEDAEVQSSELISENMIDWNFGSVCSRDPAEDYENCNRIYKLALSKKDIFYCGFLPGEWMGDCHGELAITKNDKNLCKKAGTAQSGHSEEIPCYYAFALAYDDENLCELFESKDYCYYRIAFSESNPSVCGKIASQEERDSCLSSVNFKLKEENICEQISSIGIRSGCYYRLAENNLDPELCQKVETEPYMTGWNELSYDGTKYECIIKLVMALKNETLCESAGILKETCYKSVCRSWETCSNIGNYTFSLGCNEEEIDNGPYFNCIARGGYYTGHDWTCPSTRSGGSPCGPPFCRCPLESELK